jgi:hypothetical protein
MSHPEFAPMPELPRDWTGSLYNYRQAWSGARKKNGRVGFAA